MRRLRAAKNQVALSLFPFLAVLICTMGSLIALLVVVVQNAKVQADEIATVDEAERLAEQQRRADELAERKRQQEDHEWRVEILKAQREELTKQLDERRLELSHLEEHHRRLKDRLEQLLNQASSFDNLDQQSQQNQQALAAELARLREAIARAEQDLASAREQMAATQRSFALLPYDGPNGTRRRPIYIECTADAVIIQPEGIILSPRDFSGPLGVGNPLDSALRAAREYMATNGLLGPNEEPYPLLVVRPGGSISYAAARTAMTSWDDEFGYELIDSETKLAYGESDPVRSDRMSAAVEESRKRTRMMRAAAPARFEGNELFSFNERPLTEDAVAGTKFSRADRGDGFGGSGFGGNGSQTRGMSTANANGSYAGGAGTGSRSASKPVANGQPNDAVTEGNFAGATQSNGAQSATNQFPQRIANARGANWALQGETGDATGYNRPIPMIFHADRIEIPAVGDFPHADNRIPWPDCQRGWSVGRERHQASELVGPRGAGSLLEAGTAGQRATGWRVTI